MNKPTRILSLMAAIAIAGNAWAQNTSGVNLIVNNASGAPIDKVPVTVDSKIKFTSEGVDVLENEVIKASFSYGTFATLSFTTPTSGISAATTDVSLRILNNPVADILQIAGCEAESTPLLISDLAGRVKISLRDWSGENLDVSTFAPGLYFVKIKNTTLKFIKK